MSSEKILQAVEVLNQKLKELATEMELTPREVNTITEILHIANFSELGVRID